jgi:hypothetical protein
VFTARYALSPYIKQIRFVFKGLRKKSGLQEDFKAAMNIVAQLSIRKSPCVRADRVIIDNKGKQMGTASGSLNKRTAILLAGLGAFSEINVYNLKGKPTCCSVKHKACRGV